MEDRLIGQGQMVQQRIEQQRHQKRMEQERVDTEGNFTPATNENKERRGGRGGGVSGGGASSRPSRSRSPSGNNSISSSHRKWSDHASVNSGGGGSRSAVVGPPPNRSAVRHGHGHGGGDDDSFLAGGGGGVVSRLYEWDKMREDRLEVEREARIRELHREQMAYPFQPNANDRRRSVENMSDSAAAAKFYDAVLRPDKVVDIETQSSLKGKMRWNWHRNRSSARAMKQQSELNSQENTSMGKNGLL